MQTNRAPERHVCLALLLAGKQQRSRVHHSGERSRACAAVPVRWGDEPQEGVLDMPLAAASQIQALPALQKVGRV